MLSILLLAGMALVPWSAGAQTRMNDQDVESTMNNMKDDTKTFQSSFNTAVDSSTIRKTTREQEVKTLVSQFQKQTEAILNTFKSAQKADASLTGAIANAQQIDKVITELSLGGTVSASWAKVKTELGTIAKAFNLPPPIGDKPPSP